MSHNTLENYYMTVHGFSKKGYDPAFIESCMVFERDIYVTLIAQDKTSK